MKHRNKVIIILLFLVISNAVGFWAYYQQMWISDILKRVETVEFSETMKRKSTLMEWIINGVVVLDLACIGILIYLFMRYLIRKNNNN